MNLFLASVCIQLAYLKRLPFRAEIEREKEKEENVSIRLLGIQKKDISNFFSAPCCRRFFARRGACQQRPRNLTDRRDKFATSTKNQKQFARFSCCFRCRDFANRNRCKKIPCMERGGGRSEINKMNLFFSLPSPPNSSIYLLRSADFQNEQLGFPLNLIFLFFLSFSPAVLRAKM